MTPARAIKLLQELPQDSEIFIQWVSMGHMLRMVGRDENDAFPVVIWDAQVQQNEELLAADYSKAVKELFTD